MLLDFQIFAIICGIGGFGFLCSMYSLYLIIHKSVLQNAYGFICGTHSITEGCLLFIFVVWGGAVLLINKELGENISGIIIGEIANFLYYTSIYLQMLKSVNRFFAIVFPVDYRKFFNVKLAKFCISCIVVICALQIIPFFQYDCNLFFNYQNYMWNIRNRDCARLVASWVDLGSVFLTMGVSFFFDCITFIWLHVVIDKKLATLRNDIRFFMQAFLTSFIYLNMMLAFYLWSNHSETTWEVFASTTLTWILCHTLNQLSFVLFVVTIKSKTVPIAPVVSLTI